MRTKSKEDKLSEVVQGRLDRTIQEQETLRNAVFRRLADREEALKKFALSKGQPVPNCPLSTSIGTNDLVAMVDATIDNTQPKTMPSSVSTTTITPLTPVAGEESIHAPSSLMENSQLSFEEQSKCTRIPGPWQASMRPNVQLQRVQKIRQAEEETQRVQHPIQMKERLEQKRQKERQEMMQLTKRSHFLRETIINREKEKKRREEDKRKENMRAEQRLMSKSDTTKKKIKYNQERLQKVLEEKMKSRRTREQKAKLAREKKEKEEFKKNKSLVLRLERSSKRVRERIKEQQRQTTKNQRENNGSHQKRVEEYLATTKRKQEMNLMAKTRQRKQILRNQKEEKQMILRNTMTLKHKKILNAKLRKFKINQQYKDRKLNLQYQTEQRIIAIEEEQFKKQFLKHQLQEQLRRPRHEFRTYASKLLNNVSDYQSIEELRKVGLELEAHFKTMSEQQKSNSWDIYTKAAQQHVWSSPSRPATAGYSHRRSPSNHYQRTQHRERRTDRENELTDDEQDDERLDRDETYEPHGEGRRRYNKHPSRPSSSSATKRRPRTTQSPGRRNRVIRRPSTVGGNLRRSRTNNVSFSNVGQTRGRGKTCALCRGLYGALPHRVLRKAVLETRALLGVPQANIKRWRTAVYYDQVSVCQMCQQFVVQPLDNATASSSVSRKTSRYESNAPCGPSRKSAIQVEKEQENRMMNKAIGTKETMEFKKSKDSTSKKKHSSGGVKRKEDQETKKEEDVVITVRMR